MDNEKILKYLKDIIIWQDRLLDERLESPDRRIYEEERDHAILVAKRYLKDNS